MSPAGCQGRIPGAALEGPRPECSQDHHGSERRSQRREGRGRAWALWPGPEEGGHIKDFLGKKSEPSRSFLGWERRALRKAPGHGCAHPPPQGGRGASAGTAGGTGRGRGHGEGPGGTGRGRGHGEGLGGTGRGRGMGTNPNRRGILCFKGSPSLPFALRGAGPVRDARHLDTQRSPAFDPRPLPVAPRSPGGPWLTRSEGIGASPRSPTAASSLPTRPSRFHPSSPIPTRPPRAPRAPTPLRQPASPTMMTGTFGAASHRAVPAPAPEPPRQLLPGPAPAN